MTRPLLSSRRQRTLAAGLLLALLTPISAFAHGGEVHSDSPIAGPRNWQELARSWGDDPLVWVGLGLTAVLYALGLNRTWKAAGTGHGIRRWEAWCYFGGWFSLVVALVSPLHPWGAVLFTAHMTQHEVLMLVSAPLIALGRPMVAFLRALPSPWAHALGRASNTPGWRKTWHAVANPFSAWLIHAIALWAWHIPALFDATQTNELMHALQHISFLSTALLFWWAVIHGRNAKAAYGMAVLYLFTTAIHSGLLGVLITVAQRPWYGSYAHTTQSWGLTPLEDQQLGGLIMWIPAGIVYIVAGIAFMVGWLREGERRVRLREAAEASLLAQTIGERPS